MNLSGQHYARLQVREIHQQSYIIDGTFLASGVTETMNQ